MFTCSACFSRAVHSLLSDIAPIRQTASSRPIPKSLQRNWQTQQIAPHSTVQSIRKGHHRRVLLKALTSEEPTPRNLTRTGRPNRVEQRDASARRLNSGHLDTAETQERKRGLLEELRWNTDPLKLAQTVLAKLKKDDSDGALKLVRLSDKEKVDNVVSWNHVMDYFMHRKESKRAMAVYLEMKKRGIKPDAQTYTIMLRGFSQIARKSGVVEQAMSVYRSISAANSTVKPNIIHTNAIINVCAKHGDMDALWEVGGSLPEKGAGAPDKWTYTTILNAIRFNAEKNAQEVDGMDNNSVGGSSSQVFEAAIDDGLKLWEEVLRKWRAGEVLLDEPLVCAVGRLLLFSKTPDGLRRVFDLFTQTMKSSIPADQAREPEETRSASHELGEVQLANSTSGLHGQTPTNMPIYATPGNNTLSMLMQASLHPQNTLLGKKYWQTLTDPDGQYKVQPDADNLNSYLRVLRVSRSSQLTRDLLRGPLTDAVADHFFKRGVFVIAMSTCVRDKNNPNVLDHATSIMDIMQEKLSQPDPKVMEMYVSLAIVTTPGISHLMEGKFEPDPRKNNLMRALARCGPHAVNVKSILKEKLAREQFEKSSKMVRQRMREKAEVPEQVAPDASVDNLAGFLQALIGGYDRLLSQSQSLPQETLVEFAAEKRKLSAFVTRMLGANPKPIWTKYEKENEDIEIEEGDVPRPRNATLLRSKERLQAYQERSRSDKINVNHATRAERVRADLPSKEAWRAKLDSTQRETAAKVEDENESESENTSMKNSRKVSTDELSTVNIEVFERSRARTPLNALKERKARARKEFGQRDEPSGRLSRNNERRNMMSSGGLRSSEESTGGSRARFPREKQWGPTGESWKAVASPSKPRWQPETNSRGERSSSERRGEPGRERAYRSKRPESDRPAVQQGWGGEWTTKKDFLQIGPDP